MFIMPAQHSPTDTDINVNAHRQHFLVWAKLTRFVDSVLGHKERHLCQTEFSTADTATNSDEAAFNSLKMNDKVSAFLVLPTSGGQSTEQPVAKEEGGNADEAEVAQRLEHRQMEEVAEIQAEYRGKADVKSNCAERELKV